MGAMSDKPLLPPVWVDKVDALQKLVAELSRQTRIAVDTESNSLYAYREQVCMIQFSTDERDFLVDPLALDDLSLLAPIFADENIEKVFHAAEYDLICLKRDFGFEFANLFDTMQAARILGYKSVGLNNLLAQKFEVSLNKRYQKANWGERPLPPAQIDYARLDTHYLLDLRDVLKAELKEKGRWDLAQEDFTRACLVENGSSKKNGYAPWERVSGQQDLSRRELTILKELCDCRERIAKRMDRPPFKVISDDRLLAIAQTVPHSMDELSALRVTDRQLRICGQALLEAVKQGEEAPYVERRHFERPPEAYLVRVDALKNWRKQVARGMGVESDIILPRTQLYAIAESNPGNQHELSAVMGDSSWRLAQFGRQILDVIRE
jgi:ribonuclease D